MPVVDQPSSLSLSGNLKDILVSGVTGPLSFTLSRNGVQVLNEVYQPNSQQIVQIKLKNLINELLEISVPSFMSDVYHQEKGYANFTAAVGAENITFRVVKAGVDIASVNASNFLASNFLTWQPQQKQVKYYDPEWLSYYSASATTVRVRGYFAGGTQQTITLATLAAGRLSTINVNYGHIRGKFVNQPLYYDVWTEVGSTRNSFIQRYILDTSCNDFDDVFVFENTLGGIDSVRFIGDKVNRDSYDVDSALYDEVNKEYFSEADRFIEKSTGYFKDDRARVWALEFFASAQRYHLSDGVLNRILVSKPTLESTKHQLNHFVFLFQSAKQTKYLNLPRAESLPANLEIIGPGDELFFLAPRLNEFAGITDLGNIIFPVQLPFEESWKKITFSQIADELTEIIQDRIPTPDLSVFYTKTEIDAMFEDNTHVESDTLQTVTNRGITTDKIIEPRGTRNQQLLSIPANAPLPEDVRPGENYIYVGPGTSAIPPETFGNLEDLQNVASPIPVNKFLYKGSDGIWVGVDAPGQDLTPYAPKVWVGDNFYTKAIADGLFVTQLTDQTGLSGNKEWTGRHHFDGDLAIPQAAPIAPDPTKAYIYVGEGSGATPPSGSGNLEDLQNVDDVIANNKFLYKGSDGIWVGADIPTPGNGLLTLNTGAGLQGSATFSANQTGNVTFTVSPAAGYAIPTTGQISNWETAFRRDSMIGQQQSGTAASLDSSLPNGGFISGYGTQSWGGSDRPSGASYGGYIRFSGRADGLNTLDLYYNNGHGSDPVKLWFRTKNGDIGITPWIEVATTDMLNLTLGSSAGQIGINGSNYVQLSSLNRTNMTTDISNLESWGAGFHPYFYTTGSSGFPSSAGAGFMNKRTVGTFQGSFFIDTTNSNDGVLRYSVGSTSGVGDWEIFAARSWTQNYVKSFGLGSLNYNQGWLYTSLNDIAAGNSLATSFIATNLSSPPGTLDGFTYPFGIHINASAAVRGDILLSHNSNRMAFRSGGRDLTEVWTTDNFSPSDSPAGMILERFRDPSFVYGQNNIIAYPNATGTVISRIVDSASPTGIAIRYTASGWAQANVRITFAGMITQSAAGKVFIVKMIAKIPVGWEINDQHNPTGSPTYRTWLTPKLGTGEYEEYIFKLVCGNTGMFSLANYFDLRKSDASTPNPSSANPVVSYLAFATVVETTESFINTRLRIPTTPPEYPLPGDVWVM